MLILAPPSETKRTGGDGRPLDATALALPQLAAIRDCVIDALVALSQDEDDAARVLKLGARQRGDIAANAALRTAPTLPAVDRYTGVLFDALGADSLDASARAWLHAHVLIHSAPFGPVAALDPIPAYRLAAGTRLPGLPPLRRLWAEAVTAALGATESGLILDLRSEAYTALGPVPADRPRAYVRVVSTGPDGTVRALNHFNKHAKGELLRLLASHRPKIVSLDELLDWAAAVGLTLRPGDAGELELVAGPDASTGSVAAVTRRTAAGIASM
ncbi:peroxide stress protein YaaA [Microbacterium sp. zg.Y1090]|uniref:YaaA family protein n=1 Tax=Microbacterium TaxID=33882 RepID=UPI00214ACAC6|nr:MULTISPECIES: peroxide stress protein YaaA [unclassified Microbacterium]MCR2813470.1 peroxide stress protein YaaA [Microbacterium sp. zg.Y1084]MCR2818194.1 peroxide stress protein YaaA [Microbacterium sp. zg.Y1090]MDL5486715.1 peroxide stress protein YaaA [Microbacterium sp. zg-Y1211]WIM27656.1 peroxide stress protein YaaA [Microbacterium sp. zg-Y1090]